MTDARFFYCLGSANVVLINKSDPGLPESPDQRIYDIGGLAEALRGRTSLIRAIVGLDAELDRCAVTESD